MRAQNGFRPQVILPTWWFWVSFGVGGSEGCSVLWRASRPFFREAYGLLSSTGDSQDTQTMQSSRSVGRPPTNGRFVQLQRGQSGSGNKRKESLFQRIKRAASQPALAGPSAPPVSQAGLSAIASVSSVARSDSRSALILCRQLVLMLNF